MARLRFAVPGSEVDMNGTPDASGVGGCNNCVLAVLATAELAIEAALAVCQRNANKTGGPAEWTSATELRCARRHVGAAVLALARADARDGRG